MPGGEVPRGTDGESLSVMRGFASQIRDITKIHIEGARYRITRAAPEMPVRGAQDAIMEREKRGICENIGQGDSPMCFQPIPERKN